MVQQYLLTLPAHPKGFHIITDYVIKALPALPEAALPHIFIQHTSAGLAINENADPDVISDLLFDLNRVYPVENRYYHQEGNSHAHIKASFMGSSCTVIVENGRLKLGTWQSIFFCEFDGPRRRKVIVHIQT